MHGGCVIVCVCVCVWLNHNLQYHILQVNLTVGMGFAAMTLMAVGGGLVWQEDGQS